MQELVRNREIEKARDFTTFWSLFGAVHRLEKTKSERNEGRGGGCKNKTAYNPGRRQQQNEKQ